MVGAMDPYWGSGKINARGGVWGIQRTRFYVTIRCVSDHGKIKGISHAIRNETYYSRVKCKYDGHRGQGISPSTSA